MGEFAPINGATMYYEVSGSGQPLVMLHAGIADSRMWNHQFHAFAEKYRVVRYDMRGYGKTEMPVSDYAHRADLAALLDHLGIERAILMGCSRGGGVAIDFTLERPNRVAALVLVASGPNGLELDVPLPPIIQEIIAADKADDIELLNQLEVTLWVDGTGRTPEQVNPEVRRLVADMNMIALMAETANDGKSKDQPLAPAAAERIAELRVPALIVYGDRDTEYILRSADWMEQNIQGARKVLIPDTAHVPNMERPEEFNRAVLEFLASIAQ